MPRADENKMAPFTVREIENDWITLRDGTRLAVRLWLPEGQEGAAPAILEYLPYRKRDYMRRRDEGIHRYFASHGYACVRVDMRGSGESDGIMDDEYLLLEQDDALEVIEWIARQGWCSGRIGMMGKSWGAYNSLQVAARRPPALKAIIAVMGTDDRYAECIHYSGGCLLNDNFWWGCIMQIFNARPPDPAIVGERWRAMWLERLNAETFWPEIWLRHQHLDDYWRHGSVCFNYDDIACPTWFWGGWQDLYRDTPLRLAAHLKVPHRLTMGPWAHLYPHEAVPGPAVGFLQEALRWWDHWLKDRDTGVMNEPPLAFYLMDGVDPATHYAHRPGEWITENAWPSPNVGLQSWYFTREALSAQQPAAGERWRASSPQTVGLEAGDWGSFGVPGDLPGDQALDAEGCVQFDSPPLAAPLEHLGNASIELDVSANRPQGFIAARLIEVSPNGSATLVSRGFLNLSQRHDRAHPTPVNPGERMTVVVQLTGTAYRFRAGHRLRVALSSAYWPIVWPSPQPVELTVFGGNSRLSLPVRKADSAAQPYHPAPPLAGPLSPFTVLRKGRLERATSTDPHTGEVVHRLYVDGGVFGDIGKFRLDDIGLEMSHLYERIYRIRPDDPNSAVATMTQSYEMGRGDWQVRIDAGATMTSTPTTFELEAWIEAHDGVEQLCRRTWQASIPRSGL